MSKLVRARVKAVEYLPEWAKCCEEGTQARERLKDAIFDMERPIAWGPGEICCHFCGFDDLPTIRGYYRVGTDSPEVIDFFDLDEGPLEGTQ